MPHFRPRHLLPALKKGLNFSPLVALLGHRQVGKTTLATHISSHYYTLDLRATRDIIEADPIGFLDSIKEFPAVLDEAQLLPDLFPALKEHVRIKEKVGQFILTGSVRFSGRKQIVESLTGRVIYFELLPMDVSEIHQEPLPDTLVRISTDLERFQTKAGTGPRNIETYLRGGGLPGAFAIRDKSLFNQKMATQIETILERDLRLIVETPISYQSLKVLYTHLALHQGEPLEPAAIATATRLSRPTVVKLLRVFSILFLVRTIASEGTLKKAAYYLEDQGEATHLIGLRTDPLFDLNRFLYANLRCQIHYRPELNAELFQYRTRSGVHVPFVFRLPKGEVGIIPILEDNPSQIAIASAQSFLKAYSKGKVVFATYGKNDRVLSPAIRIIPAASLVLG